MTCSILLTLDIICVFCFMTLCRCMDTQEARDVFSHYDKMMKLLEE